MGDPNGRHKITFGDDGRLALVPNPTYRPILRRRFAPAASSPHTRMSGATADEAMVIDSSDDEVEFDDGRTSNANANANASAFQRRTNSVIKLDSPSDEEVEWDADGEDVVATVEEDEYEGGRTSNTNAYRGSRVEPIELDELEEEEVEWDVNAETEVAPTFELMDLDPEIEDGGGVEDDDNEDPHNLPTALDSFDEGQDVGLARLDSPANERVVEDNLTFEASHCSPSSPSTSEIFNVNWDVPEPEPAASDLPTNAGASDAPQHPHSSPSKPDLPDDLEDNDPDILPSMNIKLPISSRKFWERRIRIPSEGNLSISAILNRLGIRRSSGTRGVVSYTHEKVKQLADAVTQAANTMPVDDADELIDIASEPEEMSDTVKDIWDEFGDEVWGGIGRGEREWLMDKEVGDGLWKENEDDVLVIKEFIRLWIIVKAINTFNYLKYRKPGAKVRSARRSGASTSVVEQRSVRGERERTLSDGEMDISDDDSEGDNIVVKQPTRRKDRDDLPDLDGHHDEENPEANGNEIRETPQPMEQTTIASPELDPMTAAELDTEIANATQQDESMETALPTTMPSIESRPEGPLMDQNPESGGNLEGGDIATADNPSDARGSALRKTKAALDKLSISSPAAAAADSSLGRPTRSTRKAIPTYNLAILNGRARHTPTKYLEKHHKNVLHGSVDDIRTGNPYHSSEIARFRQEGGTRSKTVSVTPEADEQDMEDVEPALDERPPNLARPLKKGPKRRRRATSASSKESFKRPVPKKAKSKESVDTPSTALTTFFLAYLESGFQDPSTALLLDTIERDLALLTPHLSTIFSHPDFCTTFLASITAWLNLQRTIHSVQQRLTLPPKPQHTHTYIKMVRSRMLTELRIARNKYIEAQEDRAGTKDDVLCVGFEGMQDGKAEEKKVGKVVREGLEGLDEMLAKLGDELGFGGGEWVRVR